MNCLAYAVLMCSQDTACICFGKNKKIIKIFQLNFFNFTASEKSVHYENMPMQYIDFCEVVKIENFQKKIFDISLIFGQNTDCGYTLEPPRQDVLRVPTTYVFEQKLKT